MRQDLESDPSSGSTYNDSDRKLAPFDLLQTKDIHIEVYQWDCALARDRVIDNQRRKVKDMLRAHVVEPLGLSPQRRICHRAAVLLRMVGRETEKLATYGLHR